MRKRREELARRFLDDDQHRIEERFRGWRLPHYRLPLSFSGPRVAGVCRTTAHGRAASDVDTETEQFELIHGDPWKAAAVADRINV